MAKYATYIPVQTKSYQSFDTIASILRGIGESERLIRVHRVVRQRGVWTIFYQVIA